MPDALVAAARPAEPEATERRGVFTVRAFILGIGLTAFLAWLSPVVLYDLFSARIHYAILPPGVVAAFIPLVAANFLVGRRYPRHALTAGELAVIFAMMWVGIASLFQIGATDTMMALIAAPNYFASPENRWADYYLGYMPAWLIPSNSTGAIGAFFNGLRPGAPIPWGIWVVPLVWWGSLVAALLGVVICVMAIVHEQWHDHEKLTFPMADIGLVLSGRDGVRGPMPTWLRSGMFWTGAAFPLAIMIWNIVGWFHTQVPHITFSQEGSALIFFRVGLSTKLDFFTLGLAYFAPIPVLRGFVIGAILIIIEMAMGMRFGFADAVDKGFEPWGEWGTTTAAWQCTGSMVTFVLWGFWIGRTHFARVFRSAVTAPAGLSDRLRRRYRVAVWGLGVSLLYLALWFHAIGMSWLVIAMFLPLVLVLNLGISKLIIESSLVYAENPVSAQTIIMHTLGTARIPQVTMTAMALSYVIFRANAGMMMPQVGFAGRLGDEHGVPRGKVYGAAWTAVLVALCIAVGTVIMLAYRVGAFNFQSLPFRNEHADVFDSLARKSDAQFGTDWWRMSFFAIGALLMAAVLAIRSRYANFWLHPIGLTFSTTSVVTVMLMNILLAWIIKAILSRLGGVRLMDRWKLLFLGFICGHCMGLAIGIGTDAIWFPGAGHNVLTLW